MGIFYKLCQGFWRITEKSDDKVHARQTVPEGVREIRDIPYIDDGTWQHKLDVYYPAEAADEKLPVIIDIHGGGWMYASKDLNYFYNMNLAKRGFCVFSISYTLVPDCLSPVEQLQDCAYALKWISENMADYPADSEHIMLTGDSAGGMLAGYTAALMNSPKLREIFGTVAYDMKLDALTLTSPVAYMDDKAWIGMYTRRMWGKGYKNKPTSKYMDFDKALDEAEDYPPTFLVTSSGDFLALKQTRRAAEDLRKRNIPCELMDWEKTDGKDLPHVFAVLEPALSPGVRTIDRTCEFFREHIK